ncbi:nascent polypeptide-associated complex subunit alpha [Drosophila obscura]|uniref:nascent polypeptide-associated complex subunit alpha n=1 Tax=Drosophila obscura TaxID=7282 RepID=UPI000BA01806|nr:nascent polypeptide-associated complex subunit alpha [Drosophila obscura]
MGKKQKMKKAAAKIAATAAAAAAAAKLKISLDETAGPSTSKKNDEKLQELIEITKHYAQVADGSTDDDLDSDDEVPENLTVVPVKERQGGGISSGIHKQSRGEKKARRLLMKLDLKPVENVSRVAMRKNKNILLYIDQPEVYKIGETYLCFGDVKVEDIVNTAAAQAAERYRLNAAAEEQNEMEASAKAQAAETDKEDPEIDESLASGLDVKDIELVQMQSNCSRKKAIKALLDNENDVVNAIMALTVASS